MQTTATPRTFARRAAAALLLVASGLASGCATGKQKLPEQVWPPPPEKARIQYVRSFGNPRELGLSTWRKLLQVVLPLDPNLSLHEPFALALSPDGRRLYVSNGRPTRIIVVDLEKSTMSFFAERASKAPILIFGLATDADENVYVSDRKGNVVLVYDRGGHFVRKFGETKLQTPSSIAVDRVARKVYVVSGASSRNNDHRIEVFSLKGDHLRTIGKRGEGPGEFNFPDAVAIGPDRSLYVVDKLNFRIQVFDPDGNLADQFGVLGRGSAGFFDKIRSIAFDTFGDAYIVDTQQGVHVLNPKHQPLLLFASPPFMDVPHGIAIDPRNRIFVSDYAANQVHEFQLVNTTAADIYLQPAAAEPAKPNAAPASGGPIPKAEAAPRP